MLIIPTKYKIFFAKLLSKFIALFHRLISGSDQVRVSRRKIIWDLDLTEGIDLAIYLGMYENATLAAIKKIVKPGSIVADIGANIGAITLPLAQCVGSSGKVYAFEPTLWAYQKLSKNISLNPNLQGRIQAEQIMLLADGQQPPDSIYSSWNLAKPEDDQTHPEHMGRLMSTENVTAMTLDAYFELKPNMTLDLIKLDVDGYELPVLKGSKSILMKHKPIIILEVAGSPHDDYSSVQEMLDELKIYGYGLKSLISGRVIQMDQKSIKQICPRGGGVNVLAVPNL